MIVLYQGEAIKSQLQYACKVTYEGAKCPIWGGIWTAGGSGSDFRKAAGGMPVPSPVQYARGILRWVDTFTLPSLSILTCSRLCSVATERLSARPNSTSLSNPVTLVISPPLLSVISTDFVATCIVLAREYSQGPTETDFSELSLYDDSASSTSLFRSVFYLQSGGHVLLLGPVFPAPD